MGSLAQYPIQEIAGAIVLIIVGVLSGLGYTKGAGKKDDPVGAVIAGAIVDNQAIYKLASSIDEHNLLANKHLHVMQEIGDNLEKVCVSIEKSCHSMDRMAEKVSDAATYIVRSGNMGR